MNSLRLAIDKIFKGAAKSLYRFPAAIISAVIISIAAFVRISRAWNVQKTYNLLFDSIQIAFVLGVAFSIAAVTLEEVKPNEKKSFFVLANTLGIDVACLSFLLLYLHGGRIADDQTAYLSSIAIARVSVAIFISLVAFVYFISRSKQVDGFSDALFITHRAFIVSATYGLVIMLGTSGVLGAFQALIYKGMNYRVYQYLGVIVGFITFTLFLGYFPSFKEGEDELEMAEIKEQPRFIVVLLAYILIPIMMALTVVLLIWSARVVFKGVDVSFNTLSGIASSYVVIGIWLHVMVARHETNIVGFYKKSYLLAGLLILLFEAWALVIQLSRFGLKTAEYSFLMIWIFGLISILLLISLNHRAYRKIAITSVIISLVWVMPIIGYSDITFNSQVKRLEKILIEEEILVDGSITNKAAEIDQVKKGEITDAVDFIVYSDKTNKPIWFKKEFNNHEIFKETFGFDKTYGIYPNDADYSSMTFFLKDDAMDISDYSLSLNTNRIEATESFSAFVGPKGTYEFKVLNEELGIPKITVKLNDIIIIESDMREYLTDIIKRYPPESESEINVPLEDMSIILESEDISILIVVENINAYFDKQRATTEYYVAFQGIYVRYK